MDDLHRKSQSLLALYFFLLLEPHTERAIFAYTLLQEQFRKDIVNHDTTLNDITIEINPEQTDSTFAAADFMISTIEVVNSNIIKNDTTIPAKTEAEIFQFKTSSFLNTIKELTQKDTLQTKWEEVHIPLLFQISQSPHLPTYCYYISQSADSVSSTWLQNHSEELTAFGKWLQTIE